jgi:DDB1- and CUL4-associated factor 5
MTTVWKFRLVLIVVENVAGGDDRRVLLWNVQEAISGIGVPSAMKGEHHSNIFCIAFDNCNKKIFSSGKKRFLFYHIDYS